jgi:hypothetical protein
MRDNLTFNIGNPLNSTGRRSVAVRVALPRLFSFPESMAIRLSARHHPGVTASYRHLHRCFRTQYPALIDCTCAHRVLIPVVWEM